MNKSSILVNYSYGAFLRMFPNASRKERLAAVKRFYDFTHGELNKIEIHKKTLNKNNKEFCIKYDINTKIES